MDELSFFSAYFLCPSVASRSSFSTTLNSRKSKGGRNTRPHRTSIARCQKYQSNRKVGSVNTTLNFILLRKTVGVVYYIELTTTSSPRFSSAIVATKSSYISKSALDTVHPLSSVDFNTIMTSRTLRKRQRAGAFSDDIDFDLEEILNDHEEEGIAYRAERDAKKAKEEEQAEFAEAFSGYEIALTDLPALCIERIMTMMDSPRDLYNLAFSSKLLMNIVTPGMVIRSAVLAMSRGRMWGIGRL